MERDTNMKPYKSIYQDEILKKFVAEYKEDIISSSQLMKNISKMKFQEMSITKDVKSAFVSYDSAPLGGVWLKNLVKGFRPIYVHFLSVSGDKTLTFAQIVQNNMNLFKNFETTFPTDKDKEKFWKIIYLISEELSSNT